GGRSGCACDVGESEGAGDVDAFVDGGDPGGAGVGDDDAGGAEDGEAAEDSQTGIHGLLGDLFAVGDGDFDDDVAPGGEALCDFGDGVAHHGSRHGVDGGVA